MQSKTHVQRSYSSIIPSNKNISYPKMWQGLYQLQYVSVIEHDSALMENFRQKQKFKPFDPVYLRK